MQVYIMGCLLSTVIGAQIFLNWGIADTFIRIGTRRKKC